jgi:hypothetical protein
MSLFFLLPPRSVAERTAGAFLQLKLLPLILALTLAGCGAAEMRLYDETGKLVYEAHEFSVAKDLSVKRFTAGKWNGNRTTIEGGASTVDAAVVGAAVEATIKGLKP